MHKSRRDHLKEICSNARGVYWLQLPDVRSDGYFNFTSEELLKILMDADGGFTDDEDLTIRRNEDGSHDEG